jgi:AAA15 family ATPase/GTPase
MINKIKISNFLAIRSSELSLNDLKNINHLIRENGSGKSSLLDAIHAYFKIDLIYSLNFANCKMSGNKY